MQILRIEAARERRRSDEIAEHHGDEAALGLDARRREAIVAPLEDAVGARREVEDVDELGAERIEGLRIERELELERANREALARSQQRSRGVDQLVEAHSVPPLRS